MIEPHSLKIDHKKKKCCERTNVGRQNYYEKHRHTKVGSR